MAAPHPVFTVSRELPGWVQKGNTQYHNRHGGPAEVAKNVLTQWSIVGLTSEELTRDGGIFSGDITPDVVVDWGMAYSDRFLDEMAALGKTQVQVNWSCGFSLEGEAIQRDIVTEFARKARRRGIHICAYMSLTNIFWKEAFQREPELEGYLARYTDGSPHLYGNSQARYLACVNQPEWLEYLKNKMRLAIEGAQVDHVYFDNIFADCACDLCVAGFADYTQHLLGEALDLPQIELPSTKRLYLETNVDVHSSTADDDSRRRRYLHRRYLAWRLAEALKELRDYAFTLKFPLAFSANNHLYPFINDVSNVLYSQDTRVPGPEWSNIPLCRYLDSDSDGWKPVVTNHQLGDADPRLSMAEAMAFQSYPYQITHQPYNLFYRDHPELFTEVEPVAKIGVLLEWPRRRPYYLMPLGFANLMYEVVLLEKWSRRRLDRYDVILLPDLEAVSDELFEALKTYSEGRGTVVCTGASTLYDESGSRRDQPMERVEEAVGSDSRIGADTLDLIRAASDPQPIEVAAPANVVANLVRRAAGTQYIVHLVNYGDSLAGPVHVRLNTPDRTFGRATALSPDSPTLTTELELSDGASFSVDTVEVYSIVALT